MRIFDILLATFAIVVLLPFMLPLMVVLKLTGEHYIFYQQTRAGRRGLDFKVLKFATMLKNSPNMSGGVLTQKNDSRILPLGGFLRKTKLNELPQLINVFLGSMSFVGPRPQARQHYDLYSLEVKAKIDKLRPGLTGIGSLVFRDEESILDRVNGDRVLFHDTVIAPYKGELESWYAKNRNVINYFAIIFFTIWAVFRPTSRAYLRCFKNLPKIPTELASLL